MNFCPETIVKLSEELIVVHSFEDTVDLFKYSDTGQRIPFDKIVDIIPDLGVLNCGIGFEHVFYLGYD